jgi:uncharacterized damage-inducible protein DinB
VNATPACTPGYATLMAEYNRWMNAPLYDICAGVPDADRRRHLGVYFRSIHGTLNHLLYGDRSWLSRFIGRPYSVTTIGQELYVDFAELWRERAVTDAQIVSWSTTLTPEWLDAPLRYTSNVDGVTRELPAGILIAHFFNHQTHHRGQITVLLDQLGHDHGITDIPWLPSLNAVVAMP